MNDWTPVDRARRLVQIRHALEVLHLPRHHREGMEELACNIEMNLSKMAPVAPKGN
jgi:hypothetical protein